MNHYLKITINGRAVFVRVKRYDREKIILGVEFGDLVRFLSFIRSEVLVTFTAADVREVYAPGIPMPGDPLPDRVIFKGRCLGTSYKVTFTRDDIALIHRAIQTL